jgi:hypothetical protein
LGSRNLALCIENVSRIAVFNGSLITLTWGQASRLSKLNIKNGKCEATILPDKDLVDSLQQLYIRDYGYDVVQTVLEIEMHEEGIVSFESLLEDDENLYLAWYIKIYTKDKFNWKEDYIAMISEISPDFKLENHKIIHHKYPGFPDWSYWDKTELRWGNYVNDNKIYLLRNLSEIKINDPIYKIYNFQDSTVNYSDYKKNKESLSVYHSADFIVENIGTKYEESVNYGIPCFNLFDSLMCFSLHNGSIKYFETGEEKVTLNTSEELKFVYSLDFYNNHYYLTHSKYINRLKYLFLEVYDKRGQSVFTKKVPYQDVQDIQFKNLLAHTKDGIFYILKRNEDDFYYLDIFKVGF